MKVLALSAYAAGSHSQWLAGLQAMFADWHWQVLSLPPRHFSWRVRGNPLFWSIRERETLGAQYDLLVATSLVDLATLRGLVPQLARIPTVLYFHENQFEYPQHEQQHSLLEAQMVSLYGALAADQVAFNSSYNRDTFLEGCTDLLRRLPDFAPLEAVRQIADKCTVVPVPVQVATVESDTSYWTARESAVPPLRLAWVGRLEHDKGAEGLLALLELMDQQGMDYELAVVGQQFRQEPAAFTQVKRDYSHRLVHFGYLESRLDYQGLLHGADVVLSTATHEFQGLAVMEAVLCGCVPLLPSRLVYEEIYPANYLYRSSPGDVMAEAHSALDKLREYIDLLQVGRLSPPDLGAWSPEHLRPRYAALFDSTCRASG